MAVSELPLVAENVQSARFAAEVQPVEQRYLADEEFPPDLPVRCESILQDACHHSSPYAYALIAATVVAILACCLVYGLPKLYPSLWASPSPSPVSQ